MSNRPLRVSAAICIVSRVRVCDVRRRCATIAQRHSITVSRVRVWPDGRTAINERALPVYFASVWCAQS